MKKFVSKDSFEDLGFAKLDVSRESRTGTSEAVYCAGKTSEQLLKILRTFRDKGCRVLGTKCSREQAEFIANAGEKICYDELSRTISLADEMPARQKRGRSGGKAAQTVAKLGPVAVCCAGTADLSIAEEDPKYDKKGNRIETKFEKLSKLFEQITGREVGTSVDMIGRPVYNNVKLLVDVFPFRNKKWFFTGGFYYGSTDIARTYNRQEDITALYSVDMYNRLYDKVMTAYDDPWNPFNDVLLFEHNGIPYYIPTEMADMMHTYMSRYGKMGVHLGDYFLVPDENCMVKATVKANRFKPYLGFGYGNATPKGDKRPCEDEREGQGGRLRELL